MHLSFDLGGAASDARDVSFGIREITYALPGSDNLAISVNGVPVMCKGGDWGMDEAMKRIPRERLEAQIRDAPASPTTHDPQLGRPEHQRGFLRSVRPYGIMIWDEFFEPNPSDSGRQAVGVRNDSMDVRDVPMYLANVREKSSALPQPSLASRSGAGATRAIPAPPIVADGLKQIMTELEPVRLYHPNSNDGAGVRSGGPYAGARRSEYYTFP